MAHRKIPKEVEKMFDKYTTNFCRRLKKDPALELLQKEFELSEHEATIFFKAFDKDHNGELSLWEFNQFYNTIGKNAHTYLQKFDELREDGTEFVDIGRLWEDLKTAEDGEGNILGEEDLERYIKSTAGPEKKIDLPKFITLMCWIKLHRGGKQQQSSGKADVKAADDK